MTYHITFTCYGTHLRGDPRGSVDRHVNKSGQPTVEPSARLRAADNARLQAPPATLSEHQRHRVLESIQETCQYRGWLLLAAHVRTNHVHVIVSAEAPAETLLRDLKAYASRRLNEAESCTTKRWTRGGSTRSLPTADAIESAMRYVIDRQGPPMALYLPIGTPGWP